MPNDIKLARQEIIDKLKSIDNEVLTKMYVPYNVTSFSELRLASRTSEYFGEVNELVWAFHDLLDNLLYLDTSTSPAVEDSFNQAMAQVNGLVMELQAEFQRVTDKYNADIQDTEIDFKSANSKKSLEEFQNDLGGIEEIYSLNKSGYLFKSIEDGSYYFHGKISNAYYDRESDVFTSEAHKAYVDFLDENPDMAPELWSFHEKGTARESKAIWWDYVDNFVEVIWPLTETEYKAIENTIDEYGIENIGMSHGYYALSKDLETNKVSLYYSFEGSILPMSHAANPLTGVVLMSDTKGYSDEKRKFLVALHGEEVVEQLEEKNLNFIKNLDIEPIMKNLKKENESITEDQTQETQTETETEDTQETESTQDVTKTEETVVSDEIMFQQKTLKALQALTKEITTLKGELSEIRTDKEQKDRAKTQNEKFEEMFKGILSPIGSTESETDEGEFNAPQQKADSKENVQPLGRGLNVFANRN